MRTGLRERLIARLIGSGLGRDIRTLLNALLTKGMPAQYRDRLEGRWCFAFTPQQLETILRCVLETRAVDGCILEVGCYLGETTVYINEALKYEGIWKKYVGIDTFDGFTGNDVQFELTERGKKNVDFNWLDKNSEAMFRDRMHRNGFSNVETIRADAKTFDYRSIGPIAFCLIDVDLYLPVKAVLRRVHPLMSPGGIVIVDDCQKGEVYQFDGALQAYVEFVTEMKVEEEYAARKLAVLRY